MGGAGRASRKANTAAPDLTQSALLLCAHGSEGAEGAAEAHAASLRGRRCFAQVEPCYLRGSPGLAETLSGIDAGRIFLVPMLMADGYTNRVLLPEILAKAGGRVRRVELCPPVGLSRALARLVETDAAALCAQRGWEPSGTTVVIAGHGTGRHEESGASAALLAARVAALGSFRSVAAAFLEQAPSVEEALRGCRPDPCVVVGFFADHGGHSAGDIPRLIGAAHPSAAYTGAIGLWPAFVDIILDTVREAARRR